MINALRNFALVVASLVSLLGTAEASAMLDPGLGRFTQRDPHEDTYPDGMNAYAGYHSMQDGFDPSGKVTFPLFLVGPNVQSGVDLTVDLTEAALEEKDRQFKHRGYLWWRQNFVTDQHWRDVMDDWYYETGNQTQIFNGNSDPRNQDLASNPGLVKLVECWIAAKYFGTTPTTGRWIIDTSGDFVQWQFTYGEGDAAGGSAAFRSDTYFLGTYTAKLTLNGAASVTGNNSVSVRVNNTSGWTSATRVPGRFRWLFGTSFYTDHARGQGVAPSRGGNLDQEYNFDMTVAGCRCVLP